MIDQKLKIFVKTVESLAQNHPGVLVNDTDQYITSAEELFTAALTRVFIPQFGLFVLDAILKRNKVASTTNARVKALISSLNEPGALSIDIFSRIYAAVTQNSTLFAVRQDKTLQDLRLWYEMRVVLTSIGFFQS